MKRFAICSATTAIALLTGMTPSYAFTPFSSFTTNYTQSSGPTGDTILNSVTVEGNAVNSFTYVTGASIESNSDLDNLGPFSSDRGDSATGVVNETPMVSDILASLGNNNLNNIIDGEDQGTASLNLFFDQPTNHLFFFERGLNSDLMVELIDASGALLGPNYWITRSLWAAADYSIDTNEIGGPQPVGSYGLKHDALIAGIRVSMQRSYNGPDFKVVGANVGGDVSDTGVTNVPAPSMLLGLGGFVATQFSKCRRRMAEAK